MKQADLQGIAEDEWTLLAESWIPEFTKQDLSPTAMQFLLGDLYEASEPLASLVLNRLDVWLGSGERWAGDERFSATWSGKGGKRHCVLAGAEGTSWRIRWYDKYDKAERPSISLERLDADGKAHQVAESEITTGLPGSGNRQRFSNCPPPVKGTTEASLETGAVADLFDFCDAIRASVPQALLASREGTVAFGHASRLEGVEALLVADGGLPGRLCRARHAVVAIGASRALARWIEKDAVRIAGELRDAGAVWGDAVLAHGDDDYFVCAVDMAEGAFGIFGDDAATSSDLRTTVARFDTEDGKLRKVSIHLFGTEEDDYAVKVEAVREGSATADFAFDYRTEVPTFNEGRSGWAALALFGWQFTAAVHYKTKKGELDTTGDYWRRPEAEPENIPGA